MRSCPFSREQGWCLVPFFYSHFHRPWPYAENGWQTALVRQDQENGTALLAMLATPWLLAALTAPKERKRRGEETGARRRERMRKKYLDSRNFGIWPGGMRKSPVLWKIAVYAIGRQFLRIRGSRGLALNTIARGGCQVKIWGTRKNHKKKNRVRYPAKP